MRFPALGLLALGLITTALATTLPDGPALVIESGTDERDSVRRNRAQASADPVTRTPAEKVSAPAAGMPIPGEKIGPASGGSRAVPGPIPLHSEATRSPGTIRILTVDSYDRPLAGVPVGLSQVARTLGPATDIRRTRPLGRSGSDGILVVPVLASGQLVIDRPGMGSTGVTFEPTTDRRDPDHVYRLVCGPTAPLHIRALDPSGRPLVGARLVVSGPDEGCTPAVAYTDPAGEARFQNVAMNTPLDLRICRGEVRFSVQIHGPRDSHGESIDVKFAPAVATLTGRALDRTGPIAGRTLRCTFGGSGVRSTRTRTDENGRFEIQLPQANTAQIQVLELELLHANRLSGIKAKASLRAWHRDRTTPVELVLDSTPRATTGDAGDQE